jgi:hypothetical protein
VCRAVFDSVLVFSAVCYELIVGPVFCLFACLFFLVLGWPFGCSFVDTMALLVPLVYNIPFASLKKN